MKRQVKHRPENDLQECCDKIIKLLIEYNCRIEFDEELNDMIILDIDTNRFLNFHYDSHTSNTQES